MAFGDALSQEDPQNPQNPQNPLNLPENAFAFFGLNPLNIYKRASLCSLDFFLFFPLKFEILVNKGSLVARNCLRFLYYLKLP
jgi:hypothetical protein